MLNAPGFLTTRFNPYVRQLLQGAQAANNGTTMGGLASVLGQAGAGFFAGQDRQTEQQDLAERKAAQQALARGLAPVAGSPKMGPGPAGGSLSRAQSLLAGLGDNRYAGDMMANIAMQQAQGEQQRQMAEQQRIASLADYEKKKAIDAAHKQPDLGDWITAYAPGSGDPRTVRSNSPEAAKLFQAGYTTDAPAGQPMPFEGTGIRAQDRNILISIAPKIASGTATPDETMAYSMAYQSITAPSRWTDPTTQVTYEIPGMDVSTLGIPKPMGMSAEQPIPAASPAPSAPVEPQPAGPSGGVPINEGAQPKLPASALKMQDDHIEALAVASGIKADMADMRGLIESGKLDLGPVDNVLSEGMNWAGYSNENSQNYATFMSTLEKLRNDSLRLNNGVQTEGDAQRAWDELFSSVTDTELVKKRLAEIERLNERAADLRRVQVDILRNNFGLEPFDFSAIENQKGVVGGADDVAVETLPNGRKRVTFGRGPAERGSEIKKY